MPQDIGDMATTTLGTTFRLAYLVFNTITNKSTVSVWRKPASTDEPRGAPTSP